MNMYRNQTIQVRWNNTLSNVCGISNGVKQGGCLSPTLFSLYINNLINILRINNIGCWYGPHFMGVYGYADDISLLYSTVSGMKEMLKTCENFAKQHDILFNASKSQLLWFGKGKKPINTNLKMENGQVIPYVDSCIGSARPEVRVTAEPHGGAYPPCSTLPRTYSRLSSLPRCGPTG